MNTTASNETRNQKRKYWQHHINAWQQSGLNQTAYCRKHGIKQYQMSYWKNRLFKSEQNVSFVPLQVATNLPVPVNQATLKLHTPNGFCIDVLGNFDPHVLRQLIATVKVL
jgi:hypothetical protein